MYPPRETVALALSVLLGGTPVGDNKWPNINPILATAGIKSFGRRLKLWTAVDKSDKPAMFLVNYDEDHNRANFSGPDKATMDFAIVIYDDVSDPSLVPSKRMNNYLDAIDSCLKPENALTQKLTLGGLVQHCWVEGMAKVSPGDLDNQSVAVYPIKVLVP